MPDSQTPHLKVQLLHYFTSINVITVSFVFALQPTLAYPCDEHCGDIQLHLRIPKNNLLPLLTGQAAYGPKQGHPPLFSCAFLVLHPPSGPCPRSMPGPGSGATLFFRAKWKRFALNDLIIQIYFKRMWKENAQDKTFQY